MCLIKVHYDEHPICKLIVAANHDDIQERPTATTDFLKGSPNILAVRD